jgi:long-chain fatty acid transport protein
MSGRFALLLALAWMAGTVPARAQHGIVLSGGGAVNRSMGGTATAAPLDSLGALFWNPATLSALPQSEMSFNLEALMAYPELSSSVAASTFAPGVPPVPLSGTTRSDSAACVLPNFGLAHHLEDSPLTLGLGLLTVGGFNSNYPASVTNPILTPQAPRGIGLGNISAELEVYQITPTASLQLGDHLAVGIGPTISLASLRADPFIVAPPDDANGDGFATYRSGEHTPFHWGGGFQAGVYVPTDSGFNFGASFKSTQWFERFRYNAVNELGLPVRDTLRFDFPMITSVGVSYCGFERLLLASDVRYIDYRNTPPFDRQGFTPQGAVRGVGWDSVFVVTLGAQYQVTDRLSVRAGYSYNNDPEDGALAFFNVGAPTIVEHTASAGFSWQMNCHLVASLAYVHGFQNTLTGTYVSPLGPVPGTTVTSKVSADAVTLGVTVKY